MRVSQFFLTLAAGLSLIGTLNPTVTNGQSNDVLYVSDAGDNTIKSFDAETGAQLGVSDGADVSGLAGPRGMIVVGDELLVVNQNLNLPL